ncbi:signal recognition particle-docking protein FtsY [Candidatus Woesearchaeota archaeon]|nr:signal recognition particle-docking protein FtsY [Candidatus Woesearchaeota archaeon]|tara:strand:+ start:9852 stop:10952 length:1101 start_codon:yes stop_codon:yes gene_type:complete
MFKFLKKNFKKVVTNFSKKTEEELEKEPIVEEKIVQPEKKESSFESAVEEIKKDLKEKSEEIDEKEKRDEEEKKKSVFKKLTDVVKATKISEEKFDNLFEELEISLLENNVALDVIEKIKKDLKRSLVDKPLQRGKVQDMVTESLKESIESLFETEKIELIKKVKEKKPYIIMFAGINGSGKTTTIAKVAKMFKNNKLKCVIAASDTFRAAAIQQLQEHTDKLKLKLIKHDYGSDPAAVAFDAIKYAEAKKMDVVLIDTAGRQHSNSNLIEEMKKIVRVAKPDLKIFVGESITGNDCIEQAKKFNEAIGIDGIILSKADVDEKGGAAISVSYVTKKPIIYLGTGQEYEDLTPFKSELVVESLGLAS